MADGFRRARIAALLLGALLASGPSFAGPLDPTQFQSLGNLSLNLPVTYALNSIGPNPTLLAGGITYTGVLFNGIAVFDFNSVSISGGATLLVLSGGAPVALLSRTTENINGTINVSAPGSTPGAGASNTGVGQNGVSHPGDPNGVGSGFSGAGGGGFGGMGGKGGDATAMDGSLVQGGAGGKALANLGSILQGGSAGGSVGFGSGGGGGGAIELGATQGITIGGTISAAGGDAASGGGGSGGGIFIHAANVSLLGTLDVHGGIGAPGIISSHGASKASGGGGGGAVLIEYSSSLYDPGTVNTSGGPGGTVSGVGSAGSNGVFTSALVPEPSSLILLGTSTLGLIGMAAARRSRGRSIRPRGR